MTSIEAGATDTTGATRRRLADRHDVALAAAGVVALATILRGGRDQWFHLDEWSFLTGRSLTDIGGLLEAHNGHWVTLPAIIYRLHFSLFHLTTYLPYQLLVVASHLAIAVLIKKICTRVGVDPWISTVGAIVFMFFGSGVRNIIFAFQISLNGSVLIGLVLLLLASSPTDRRRDLLIVALAILGLMTSAVMVAMVGGVTATIFLGRGLRAALGFAIGPALVFGIWFVTYGGEATERGTVDDTLAFARRMTTATFDQLAGGTPVAWGLAALAIVGYTGRVVAGRNERSLAPVAIPSGLLVAWALFAGSAAISRAAILPLFPEAPAAGRYTHVGAALFLPLILLGIETLREHSTMLAPALLVLLLVGIPTNIDRLLNPNPAGFGRRDLILAVARSDLATTAPVGTRAIPGAFGPLDVTLGWLLDADAAGYLPGADDLSVATTLEADGRIALQRDPAPSVSCPEPTTIETVTLERGDTLTFAGPQVVARVVSDEGRSPLLRFGSFEPPVGIEVVAGPLDVSFEAPDGGPVEGCLIRGGSDPGDEEPP
jgi:hypothetical protein